MARVMEKAKKAAAFLRKMLVLAFKIVLAPLLVPLWYIPKGIYKLFRYGTKRFLWDDFLSYILGTVVRNSHGKVESIRFVTYGDMVHFHYAVWGSALCAILAYYFGNAQDVLALFLVLIPIWSLVVVKYEFPFDRIWKHILALVILIPLADYGVFKGSEVLTALVFPWLEEHAHWMGITAAMQGGYEAVWLWKKVFQALSLEASPGLHIFAAICWGIFFIVSVGEAWAYNRYEIDEKDLYRKQFFKGESREPVYMRGIRIVIKDILEILPFGFASLVIRINGKDRVLRNIPGLAFTAWLRGSMDLLINSAPESGNKSSSGGKTAGKNESEEDLVRSFKEERGADSEDHHSNDADEDLGDHDISAEDNADADDLAGIQDDLDAESNL